MPYSSWLKHIWVFCWIFSPDGCLPCNCSAAHSAQWQVLELILFAGFLQRSNSRQSCVCVSETSGSVHACLSGTHGSCLFHCTKRRKQSSPECCRHWKVFLIRIRSPFPYHTDTQNAVCATYIYSVISIFFVHGNSDMHVCLRWWWNLFYFDELCL